MRMLIFATVIVFAQLIKASIYQWQMPMTEHVTNRAPQSAFIVGTHKISEFIGARNLRFSPKGDALYFDSSIVFNRLWRTIGCSQIYKISLTLSDANAIASSAPIDFVGRITSGYGNAEHMALFPASERSDNGVADNRFLFSGFVGLPEAAHSPLADNVKEWANNTNKEENSCNLKDEWSEYENFEHLDRRNDIFIGHLNTGLIHRKLTEDGGFDGFPAFSADNKTVYYTSMAINGTVGAAAAQIWSMNAEDGSNKKQITFMENMLMLRPQPSSDGTVLLSECVPLFGPNNNIENENWSILKNNFMNDLYNRAWAKICITELTEKDEQSHHRTTVIKFTPKQDLLQTIRVEALYQLSNPVFIPKAEGKNGIAQKIVFSAKNIDDRENGTDFIYSSNRGNTALYWCNQDGSELEEIVAAGNKNNNPSFDVAGKRIAWTSNDQMEISTSIKSTSHIYMGDWMGETLFEGSSSSPLEDGNLVHKIISLNLSRIDENSSAIRPRIRNLNVENGAISIFYEQQQKSYISDSEDNQSGHDFINSIHRIQLSKADMNNFISGNLKDSTKILRHGIRISSPLEIASHVTRLSPQSTRSMNKLGSALTSGDESPLIAYATMVRTPMAKLAATFNKNNENMCQQNDINSNKGLLLRSDVDIYAYNALGQRLYPLVRRKGFDGEPVAYVRFDEEHNSCTMVFTSTAQKDNESSSSSIDADLWALDSCNIYSNDDQKLRPRLLLRRDGYEGEATFSADGATIVFVGSVGNDSKIVCPDESLFLDVSRTEIFSLYSNGSGLKQLTKLGGRSFSPTFMPDGRRIVFSSNFEIGDNGTALYIMNNDGTELRRLFSVKNSDNQIDAYPDVIEYDSSREFDEKGDKKTRRRGRQLCLISWSSNNYNYKNNNINQQHEGGNNNNLDLFLGTIQC